LHLHLLTVSFDLATSIFKIPRFKSLILQHQVSCKRQHKNRKNQQANFKPMTSTNRIIGSTTVALQPHWPGNIFCYINFSSFNIGNSLLHIKINPTNFSQKNYSQSSKPLWTIISLLEILFGFNYKELLWE
jgi:hypothetical protein